MREEKYRNKVHPIVAGDRIYTVDAKFRACHLL